MWSKRRHQFRKSDDYLRTCQCAFWRRIFSSQRLEACQSPTKACVQRALTAARNRMKDVGCTLAACTSGRATENSPIPPCPSKASSSAARSTKNVPPSSPSVQGMRVRCVSSNFPDCIAAERARPISKARLGGVCGSPLSQFKGKCSLLPSKAPAS